MNPIQKRILCTFIHRSGQNVILTPDDSAHFMGTYTTTIEEDFRALWDMNYIELVSEDSAEEFEGWTFKISDLGKVALDAA